MLALLPVVVSAGGGALIIAAPIVPGWAGAFVYGLGSFICHQIPERSFHLAGFQLPVCARCLGIYVGVAGGVAFVRIRRGSGRAVAQMPRRELQWLAALAAAPTLVTVALEMVGAWHPSNSTRALAGAPLGVLVGLVVMNALGRPGEAVRRGPASMM